MLGATQVAHGAPRRRAADGRRHPRRLRHQLHHRGGRTVGDDLLVVKRVAGADELRHLPLHAAISRPRRGCGARRVAGSRSVAVGTYLSHVLADRANRSLEYAR